MGVLIVLLVIVTKMADHRAQQAQAEAAEKTENEVEQLTYERDIEQIRVDGLSEIRPKLQRKLEDQQKVRAHVETEINQLNEKARKLAAAFSQLGKVISENTDKVSTDHEQKIAQLKSDIKTAKAKAAQLKSEIAGRPVVYSVVPYQGVGGSDRRPIYIECTRKGIVFQPYGIKLTEEDFLKPVITGNPFDSALLAIRQYWSQTEPGTNHKPYPLLIVRPDGASSYALARHAMKNWDDQFGYELVESEKKLTYGDADPQLRPQIESAIAQAKQFQRRVAMSLQRSQYAAGGNRQASSGGLRASPNGGFINEGGPLKPVKTFTNNSPQRGSFEPSGNNEFERKSNPIATASMATSNATVDSEPSKSESSLQSPAENQSSESQSLQALRSLQDQIKSEYSKQNVAMGSSDRQNSGTSNAKGPSLADNVQPMAASRGSNWALPTRTAGGTAYNRPIKIVCAKNELLLEPYAQSKIQRTKIPLQDRTDQSVDRLVQTVWSIIDAWGVAGVNGYWKPELNFQVLPGGEQRYAQIKQLLRGSGLEVSEIPRSGVSR
jgi:hypothetical protein